MKRVFALCLLLPISVFSEPLKLAVAANFATTLEKITTAYSAEPVTKPVLNIGSSGQLYTQIVNGADFDIFFSADEYRPASLYENGFNTQPPQTYAIGKLALFSAEPIDCKQWQTLLTSTPPRDIAIANPKLAPYGIAASEVLKQLDLATNKMPKAANVAMAVNWLHSGNVKLAIAATALAKNSSVSYCQIAQDWHKPIRQNMLALNTKPATQDFISFMQSDLVKQILQNNGYH